MDKQEYREFLDEIRKGFENGEYEMVASYADEIELGKIKEPRVLEMISDSYSRLEEYELAREALLKARDRNSASRQIAYKLSELSVKVGDLDSAVKYYEDFCRLANNDNKRFILKYEIGRAGGIPAKELIKVLETYNSREKDERWEYELARLYHEAGEESKCVATCDDIFLWYADGEYVKKALELKFSHIALTPVQQEKYEEMMSDYIDPKPTWYQEDTAEEEPAAEPDEPVKDTAAESEKRQIDDPEIDETQVISVAEIMDQLDQESKEPEEAQERTSYTAVWASAAIRAAEAESAESESAETESAGSTFDVPADTEADADTEEPVNTEETANEEEAAVDDTDEESLESFTDEPPAAPEAEVHSSKTSEITMDDLRKMIHEGNSKKAAQGVFFTMEEVSEEDIAEEAAMRAARIAAEEEAARLAEEAERIAAEEEAERQAALEEARLAAEIEEAKCAEEEAAREAAASEEDRKDAQIAELEQASSLLMAAAREASADEDDEDDLLMDEDLSEISETEDGQSVDTEPLAEESEEDATRIIMKKETAAILAAESEEPSPEAIQASDGEPVAEIVKKTESNPDNESFRRLKLKKIRNQNDSEPELEETQFISRQALMERLFASEDPEAYEVAEKIAAEEKTAETISEADGTIGATQIFSRQDILKNTVMDTVSEASDSDSADAQVRLGAAIEEILQDADAVLEVNSEETKTIRIVLSAASAAKLGITSAMLSPLASEVIKPDLVYISPDAEATQALVAAINSEFGTPRIIDNVDFSYIGLSRDDDGQMGINLDFLVHDDENIEGQISFFDVVDSYKENLEKNKDEVAAIEAERLRQIQEAVNLTAPITLPYSMDDMELDDIVITDLDGNETEETEEVTLNLEDISLIDEEPAETEAASDIDDETEVGEETAEEAELSEAAEEEPAFPENEDSAEPAESAENAEETDVENAEAAEIDDEPCEIPPWKLAALEAEAAVALSAEPVLESVVDDDITPTEIDVTRDLSVEEIIRSLEVSSEEPEAEDEPCEIPPWKLAALEAEAAAAEPIEEPEIAAENAEATAAEPIEEPEIVEENAEADEEAANNDTETVKYEIPTWKIAQIMDAEAAEQARMKAEAEAAESADQDIPEEADTESADQDIPEEVETESADQDIPEEAEAESVDDVSESTEDIEAAAGEESAEDFETAEAAEIDEEPCEIPPWKLAALEAEAAAKEQSAESQTSEAEEEAAAAAAIAEFEKHYAEVMGTDDEQGLDELGDSLADLMGNEEPATEEQEAESSPENLIANDVEAAIAEFEKSFDITAEPSDDEIEGFDELGDSLAELMADEGEDISEDTPEIVRSAHFAEPAEETIVEESEEPEVSESDESEDEEPEFSEETGSFEESENVKEPEMIEEPETTEEPGAVEEFETSEEPETFADAEPDTAVQLEQAIAQSEIAEDREYVLPADIREEMSEFLLIEGMEDSICKTVSSIVSKRKTGDVTGGNLVITGDIKSGKTFLSIALIKAVAEELQLGNGKVAKVQAELLNGKNMEKVFNKISGSDLIIENVGYLEDKTIEDIEAVMKKGGYESMVVLEGNQLAIENIFSNFPDFAELFENRIDINELSIVQWADVAIEYADDHGYVLDDMAKLALHAKINEINVPTDRLGYDNIKEIMDHAIERAEKRNVGKLFAAFSSKKNANEKREIIESDII